jgi:hypothetical protein
MIAWREEFHAANSQTPSPLTPSPKVGEGEDQLPQRHLADLRTACAPAVDDARPILDKQIAGIARTDMAVVASQA